MAVANDGEAGIGYAHVFPRLEVVLAKGGISVRQAVGDAFAFWRTSWRQAAVPLTVAAVAATGQVLAPAGPMAMVAYVVYIAAAVMAEGALFRLSLAGHTARPLGDPGPGGVQWGGVEWRLLGVMALMYLLFLVAAVVTVFVLVVVAVGFIGPEAAQLESPEAMAAALGGAGQGVLTVLIVAALAGLVWVGVRLSLALPATAAEGRVRLLSTWPMTRGAVLPIIIASILIVLPLVVVSLLAGVFDGMDGDTENGAFATAIATAIGVFFYLPISVGLLTHFYLRLRPAPPEGEF